MVFDLDCQTGFRPKLIFSLVVFGILSLLLCTYTLGSSYLAVSGYGDWGIPGQEFVLWFCLLGMMVMAVALVGFCFTKSRCSSVAIFIGSALMVTASVAALKSSDVIRMQGFARLSQESAPLVAAIHAYSEEFGYPPASLDILQVNYPEGFSVKGGELPEFEYLPGNRAMERYHGNPWILMLEAPTGPLRWDKFLYYPLQNYPPLGHGGWFETVGTWAYVHE